MAHPVRIYTEDGWQELTNQSGEPGAVEVYEQAGDPGSVNIGSMWIDTDEQIAAVFGMPTPVGQTGKWLKSVGGAAVWMPLIATDIPGLVVADTGWISLNPGGGQSAFAAPYGPCYYRKLANGVVECCGLVNINSQGAPFFTFPVGYRPSSGLELIFKTACSLSTTGETCRLNTAGVLTPQAGITAGQWISLNGITFHAG